MSALATLSHHTEAVFLRMTLGEHFDYRSIHSFRNFCKEKLLVDAHVQIDMKHTRYVDSSGVALLHCLQQWIHAPLVVVQVINCRPEIRKILAQSRFFQNILLD